MHLHSHSVINIEMVLFSRKIICRQIFSSTTKTTAKLKLNFNLIRGLLPLLRKYLLKGKVDIFDVGFETIALVINVKTRITFV